MPLCWAKPFSNLLIISAIAPFFEVLWGIMNFKLSRLQDAIILLNAQIKVTLKEKKSVEICEITILNSTL
jgi:hypothetical protein